MKKDTIPLYQGKPILDCKPEQAFRVDSEEIIYSIQQQFSQKELALRELGQNSQDADATAIQVNYRYQDKRMILEFLDDGCGMSKNVIIKNYLRLFDSSKENQKDKVGMWSLGRLSLLCYDPERIEVFTLPPHGPGYKVVIAKDLSGELYELDRETAKAAVKGEHGTLVRMEVSVDSEEGFAAEVEKANQCIEKELSWIRPTITIVTAEIKEGNLAYNTRKVNRTMTVPGRYSTEFVVRMASGTGEVRCAIGLQSKEDTGLAPITLCSGAIPIERPSGLPWTDGEDFALRGMHLILDSYDFETNIGRNVVYRKTAFMRELLDKLFLKVVVERFVKTMAKLCTQPAFRPYEYEDSLRLLLSDVCIRSTEHEFEIPEEVLEAPFLQSYVSFRPYCLGDLDRSNGPIYFTGEKPTILSMKERDSDDPGIICVCIADLPWEFRKFLENRYAGRLKEKKEIAVVVDQDKPEFLELSRRINKRLGRLRVWADAFSDRFDSDSNVFQIPNEIRVGRFIRYDGREETRAPTLFYKSPDRIYLNHNNPHIQNLMELLLQKDNAYEDLAAHLLMREVLFDPGLTFSIAQREQLLTRDLERRFHVRGFPGIETGDSKIDSMMEYLLSNPFNEEILEI